MSRDKVERLTTRGAQLIAEAVLVRKTMPPWWQIRKRRAARVRWRELMDEAGHLRDEAERASRVRR